MDFRGAVASRYSSDKGLDLTSREATSFWVQADRDVSPAWLDRLTVCAYGLIQWPWLLRSLYGGRGRDKRALLARVGLEPEALPNLGSWKADTVFLDQIVSAIERLRPATIVELGCGASTLVAAKALAINGGGQLISFDQHAGFVRSTAEWLGQYDVQADVRHAPLGPAPVGWPGHWYQLDSLPCQIDLLIIDGPPWAVHPHVRGAAESLFDRLAPGGMILLDDAARPGERVVARRWRRRWPQIAFHLNNRGAKGTLIGIRHTRFLDSYPT